MTDPYAAAPEPPTDTRRVGTALLVLGGFLLGFVAVAAMLFLRAPDGSAPAEPAVARLIQAPNGYVPLADATSGGGPLTEGRAATLLDRADVPGFRTGVLRAFRRPPGDAPRAVVVLAVEVRGVDQAAALARGYYDAAIRTGATAFPVPAALAGHGFHDEPDTAGRHAQRVVFARGARVFVVSVVTPAASTDTAEVVDLATRQAAAT